MFLRFGNVVGQAGIWFGLLIVLVAKSITLATSLSLSAIATNTRVKGGGAYYLISRSLGVEWGGAIGLVFFVAQAVSVAMYVIGFSEALAGSVPVGGLSATTIATITNVAVFLCVVVGAAWTIKVQYFILATLAASLVSFYVGAFDAFSATTLHANLGSHFVGEGNFFTMFALFFPAVTGIMAGANMSGDLRDPARAIPRGTLAAIFVTGAIYASQAILLGGARPHEELVSNNLIMADVARWPILITAGVITATLSSALGSMMGAPRILQAFARDNVFSWLRPFAGGAGTEPRRATIVTFAISQLCIWSADLNTIAPLITMFFMVTYGLLNLATFYEAITRNPSYRPRFRWCHWTISLGGAAGCLAVMFLIDWRWAIVSIAGIFLLRWYIARKEVEARWGNLQSGLQFERARRNLLRLEDELYHPKNWRPIILALSGSGWSRTHLAVYAHWLTTGHGILTLAQVIQGDVESRIRRRVGQERVLHKFIRDQQLEAFPAVVIAPHLSDGIDALVQCQGLGALRPNTVLLGWPTDPDRGELFGATLRGIAVLERSIIAVRFAEEPIDPWEVPQGTVDVWWRGRQNGELMLLLAHLLRQNPNWRSREIRLMRVIENEAGREEVHRHLSGLIDAARIHATPQVIVTEDILVGIQQTSRSAALVVMGFEAPEEGQEQIFYDRMEHWAGDLPRVLFVDSVGGMSLES